MTAVEPLLVSVINGLPDPAVIVDGRERIVHYNRPLLTLTGTSYIMMQRKVASGVKLADLVGAVDGEDIACLRRCIREGKVFRLAEVPARTADGETLVLWEAFIPIAPAPPSPVRALQIVRDVSDEARMQSSFRELVAIAEARAEDLEVLVQQRTHELSAALEEVTRLSLTDPLTGLANRRAFFEAAGRELRASRRHGRTLTGSWPRRLHRRPRSASDSPRARTTLSRSGLHP